MVSPYNPSVQEQSALANDRYLIRLEPYTSLALELQVFLAIPPWTQHKPTCSRTCPYTYSRILVLFKSDLLSTPTHLWSLCSYIVLLLLAGGSIRLRGSALLERGRGLRWGWIRHQRRQGARAWVVTSSYSTFIVFIFLFVPPKGVNQCENSRPGAQFPRKCVILI